MFYASAARGSRSGDCNPGDIDLPQDVLDELKCYDSEHNWTYELGTRTDWLDNRLRLNATLFYVDWTDLQFRTQQHGEDKEDRHTFVFKQRESIQAEHRAPALVFLLVRNRNRCTRATVRVL